MMMHPAGETAKREAPGAGSENHLELLVHSGLLLARETDLRSIAQTAADAGLQLSGAQSGTLFYPGVGQSGETNLLVIVAGSHKKNQLAGVTISPGMEIFEDTSAGDSGTIRSGDLTCDPRFPALATTQSIRGIASARSYLAVPIRSQRGELLGGLFYGHELPDVFDVHSERMVEMIAAQAGIALEAERLRVENARQMDELSETKRRLEDGVKRLGELAAIVQSSDDAILSKDLNGHILTWNPSAARIFGYSEEEIIGESILRLIPKDLQDEEQVIINKIRRGERIDHYETVRVTKTGKMLDVSLSISPLRDSTGRIIGASKVLRDVTERKRMRASLLEAEKISATGRMAATIAHEINNPLEAVVNLLYLARSSERLEEAVKYVTSAEAEVARVSHIARQTLGFYRENASAASTSIAELASGALKIYTPRCTALGIQVEARLATQRSLVIRKGEMLQVLSNLIANAIHAMSDGGTLSVSVEDTEVPAKGVMMRVADTGTGIEAEQLDHIFDAFYTTRAAVGTGIGLFVARQFVEGHGGSILVNTSTEPERHGTTMSVFLPLNTPYTAAAR